MGNKFLFLIVASIIVSCKKDPKSEKLENYSIGQDIKDYCYFKVGTWWVYEDSLTGNTDSVYVTSAFVGNDTITEQDNLGYTGIFEFFNVAIYSSYHLRTRMISANSSYWLRPNVKNTPFAFLIDNNLPSGINQNILIFLNGNLINNTAYNLYQNSQINYLGQIHFLNGPLSYSNALLYFNNGPDADVLEHKHLSYKAFVKNAGIVQSKILQGGSDSTNYQANWKLKAYHVNQ